MDSEEPGKFLFSYEVTDHDGNPADTGDGQQMGMNVGGHLDVGPHAVMAHILQFGQEFFLQVKSTASASPTKTQHDQYR